MIDQAIEEYQKKRIARIESETKRFEQMIPEWAHKHLRVELGELGGRFENEVLAKIEYPNAQTIYVEPYRPWWFPFVVLARYSIGASPYKKYDNLREAIAVATIRNRPAQYQARTLEKPVPPKPVNAGQSTHQQGG